MTSADQYRARALEFAALAGAESNLNLQVAYAQMAQGYFRLALLADQNSKTDVVYETPSQGNPRVDLRA
jgi:hypothetical protein